MFLLRSAFWLTLAFILIAPKDVDLGRKAEEMSGQAIAAGQQIIVSQILANDCDSIECVGGKALLASVLPTKTPESPSIENPMQVSSTHPVPFPRPRPDWMG